MQRCRDVQPQAKAVVLAEEELRVAARNTRQYVPVNPRFL